MAEAGTVVVVVADGGAVSSVDVGQARRRSVVGGTGVEEGGGTWAAAETAGAEAKAGEEEATGAAGEKAGEEEASGAAGVKAGEEAAIGAAGEKAVAEGHGGAGEEAEPSGLEEDAMAAVVVEAGAGGDRTGSRGRIGEQKRSDLFKQQ